LAETILEFVKRHLDAELQSEELYRLPDDFYSKVSQYCHKLRRSARAENSEVAISLISRQTEMIESMASRLFEARAKKAMSPDVLRQLLPEERYVCAMQQKFQRRRRLLLEALSAGRPSIIEFVRRNEMARNTTVRFVRRTNELVGADLRRYGPFEKDDVASIPSASADILIGGGDAVEVYTREEA
jgi:DNA replication factor GINS